ncbi:MAG TPA: response regulator [Candidatus Eisenbacteria bacterium]|nr:response regulator [Candidatus Eisenbacteria bacterium]
MESVRGWKLLLVEDDADSAEALIGLLELHGIETLWAIDGVAAIQALDSIRRLGQRPPDFVLLDLNLPNTNILSLAHQLRAHPIACPIVLVSATSPQILDSAAAEIGAVAAVRKPFGMDKLLAVFRRQASVEEHHLSEG